MNEKLILAHREKKEGVYRNQTLKEHSEQTACYSSECGEKIGLNKTTYFLGLIHDMGKASINWQNGLRKAVDEKQSRIGFNHSYASVHYIISHCDFEKEDLYMRLATEIMAAAVGSHHALFDIIKPLHKDDGNALLYRASDNGLDYVEIESKFFESVLDEEKLKDLFDKARVELIEFIRKMESDEKTSLKTEMHFKFGFLVRLLASMVMEGDRRNTSEFYENKKKEVFKADTDFWDEQLKYMENKIDMFSCETPLNRVRKVISRQCRNFAEKPQGIYRLTVPTGSGKTLSSLRYALAHSMKYDKERIFYFIPYLSIIDQNIKDIREYIQDEKCILEHHSDLIKSGNEDVENSKENEPYEPEVQKLLVESWGAPLTVSTTFQLLDTLFSDETSTVRRMKSLCNSVIIIDEVQTIPQKFAFLFSNAMNFLAQCCNTTVILCSATQPPFDKLHWPLRLGGDSEMVVLSDEEKSVFNRVEIINKVDPYGMTVGQAAEFALEQIQDKDSLLIICNTRKQCRAIYEKIADAKDSEIKLFHLSTTMCKEHRKTVLDEIGKTPGLKEKRKVICVSTQLVEAGIDFSFEAVIRVWAGMDSIVQAAGRCNRSNDWGKTCSSYIIKLQGEQLGSLKAIRHGQAAVESILMNYQEGDLISDDLEQLVRCYYDKLYQISSVKEESKYPIKIDKKDFNICQLLSIGAKSKKNDKMLLHQAFKTAGRECKVFDDDKVDVIVPFNEEAQEYIDRLGKLKDGYHISDAKHLINLLGQYAVSLFKAEVDILDRNGKLDYETYPGALILDKSAYSKDVGVRTDYFESNDFMSA